MALFGSIGRFFSSGPGAIIFPPVALGLNIAAAVVHGEGLAGVTRREAAIYGLSPSSHAAVHSQVETSTQINPDTRLQAVGQGAFVQQPFTSGAYFADVALDVQPSGFYGGESWQTDSMSGPSPVITRQVSEFSRPAQTPDLFQTAEGFLPILAAAWE